MSWHVCAVSTVNGRCCENGVTDAVGNCCPSGVVDSFGVCDGIDASGTQEVTLAVTLPVNVTLADLSNATSSGRQFVDELLVNHTSHRLGRASQFVNVTGYSASRRLSAGEMWTRTSAHSNSERRVLTTTGAVATVALLPYGGSNNLPSSTLSTLLVGGSGDVTVSSLNSVAVVPVCGNGVCETGERPDAANGVAGCPGDCPYPVGDCPVANGQVRGCCFSCPIPSLARATYYLDSYYSTDSRVVKWIL